jgi:hypothetical protein
VVQPSRPMGFDWADVDKDTVVSPSTAKTRAAAGLRSMTWPAANNANATGLTTNPQNGSGGPVAAKRTTTQSLRRNPPSRTTVK